MTEDEHIAVDAVLPATDEPIVAEPVAAPSQELIPIDPNAGTAIHDSIIEHALKWAEEEFHTLVSRALEEGKDFRESLVEGLKWLSSKI